MINNVRNTRSSATLGLATGLDTASVIDGMLMGTQQKIDRQLGLKQQITWKQQMIRDVISSLHTFQRSFFDGLNPKTNLLSEGFFLAKRTTTTSSSVSAIATANAASEVTIDRITQLAKPSQLKGNSAVSSEIRLTIDADMLRQDRLVRFNLDGVEKSITLKGSNNTEMLSFIRSDLSKLFGSAVAVDEFGAVTVEGNRRLTILGGSDALGAIGLSHPGSNRLIMSSSLDRLALTTALTGDDFRFSINHVEFVFTKDNTLLDVINRVNQSDANVRMSYNEIENRFVITSDSLGEGIPISVSESQGNLLSSLLNSSDLSGSLEYVNGANAILSVDGKVIERNNNSFDLSGFSVTLSQLSNVPVTISSQPNQDSIVDGLTKFVDQYNLLIDQVSSMISEKSEYRDYPPLTDSQKKDMSENEIELWEKKAKTGLLRNEPQLQSLLNDMRSALLSSGAVSGLSLSELGITSGGYAQLGRLSVDENKLRKAINENGTLVQSLFTDQIHGISRKMNNVIQNAARSSVLNPGSLVVIAGIANTSSATKNLLFDRIISVDRMISNLQRSYEVQKDRYWKQFTNLEKVMSRMNAQSSWLQQQLTQE